MPVVSPSRYPSAATSSALSSGSFRSTLTSSTSSGTYVRSSYGDKTTEYRSHYSDIDGKRERKSSLVEYTRSSRAPSITDSDSGISTRYRSERSESRSRDLSTSRSDCGKSPASLTPAEFYKKYSPANYVPKTQRLAQAEIARSKSISGDIGRPPAPDAARTIRTKPRISSVISERLEPSRQRIKEGSPTSVYAKRGDNGTMDSNGNEVPSVSEIRKRFDSKMTVTKLPSKIPSRHRGSGRDDVPVHSSNGKSDMNGDWDFSEPNHSISKATSEPVSLAKPIGDKKVKSKAKETTERLTSVKSQLDPNNPIGKILENSTVIHVENRNGDSDVENKRYDRAGSDNVEDKPELESDNDTNDVNLANKKKNTIKYIDSEADGALDYDADSPSDTGFENKTFEHENYLMKRGEDDRRMDTSSESIGSDLTEDSSPEYPAARRKLYFDEELAGGKSGPSGHRRSCERYERYNNDEGPHYNGLNGLRNIGNTCFMNSVLQCLSNTRPLLEYVSEDKYMSEINTSLSGMKGALIKAFGSVIKELWRPGERDSGINTTTFKSQVQRFAPRFMGYSQQDAQEFLRYLLEGLHEDVNRVTLKPKPILTEIDDNLSDTAKATEAWSRYLRMEDSRIGDIFMGQLKSTLRCTHCQHDSVTFDPFWDLSLPIPSRTGNHRLQQCLQLFTREEELDGDEKPTCSKCGVRRKCLKWFTVQKFPQVLVLHLKRFSPTERFRGKLSVHIEFPLNGLDMSPYAANKGQEATYNLYAVSNHSGTTYSGHYTAYCKHPYGGEWHEYNDSRVTPISSRNVVSAEAYVLFYELAKPSTT